MDGTEAEIDTAFWLSKTMHFHKTSNISSISLFAFTKSCLTLLVLSLNNWRSTFIYT